MVIQLNYEEKWFCISVLSLGARSDVTNHWSSWICNDPHIKTNNLMHGKQYRIVKNNKTKLLEKYETKDSVNLN